MSSMCQGLEDSRTQLRTSALNCEGDWEDAQARGGANGAAMMTIHRFGKQSSAGT